MIDYDHHIRKILDRQTDLNIGARMNVYRSAMRACEVKFGEGDPLQFQEQQKRLASAIELIEAEYSDQSDMRPADPVNDPVKNPPPKMASIVTAKISQFSLIITVGIVALISIGGGYLLWDNEPTPEDGFRKTLKVEQGLSIAPTTMLFNADFANDRNLFLLELNGNNATPDYNSFIKNDVLKSVGGMPASKGLDIFGSKIIPINANAVYSATIYVRFQEGIETAKRPDISVGVITYTNDNQSNITQDNPRKYFVIRGKPRKTTFPDKQGWFKLTGQISRTGGDTHKIFKANTTYVRPVIRLDTSPTNSTVEIRSFKFERVETD